MIRNLRMLPGKRRMHSVSGRHVWSNKWPACGGQRSSFRSLGCKWAYFCPKSLLTYALWSDCSPCNGKYVLVNVKLPFCILNVQSIDVAIVTTHAKPMTSLKSTQGPARFLYISVKGIRSSQNLAVADEGGRVALNTELCFWLMTENLA